MLTNNEYNFIKKYREVILMPFHVELNRRKSIFHSIKNEKPICKFFEIKLFRGMKKLYLEKNKSFFNLYNDDLIDPFDIFNLKPINEIFIFIFDNKHKYKTIEKMNMRTLFKFIKIN